MRSSRHTNINNILKCIDSFAYNYYYIYHNIKTTNVNVNILSYREVSLTENKNKFV